MDLISIMLKMIQKLIDLIELSSQFESPLTTDKTIDYNSSINK